jgi:hypothetical protein
MTSELLQSLIYCLVNKVRFTHNGPRTTEELYGLALTSLDTIYKGLQTELAATDVPGLIKPKATTATIKLQHMMAVVASIYQYKEGLRNEQVLRAAKTARDAKIDSIIAAKEDDALADMTIEELLKLKEL